MNFAKLAYDANVADLDKKMALYGKDSLEYKNLQAQKEGLEADYITKLGGFFHFQRKFLHFQRKFFP